MNVKESIKKYIRATDYLSAVQIYLRDNFLLKEPLRPEHIKSRLLGHWGTCPGINFVYAHLNRALIEHDLEAMFLLGPGHGFPAIQANLFLEGTLSKYYDTIPRDKNGLAYMVKEFSWPYGFPSHSNPEAPGVILEGGELGYALSTAYGAVLDNPNLIAACLIGDGEAETGATATAWHLNKLLDPAHNGAVLPILHLNGYKISGPTLFGRMNNTELIDLFSGYGYEPYIVDAYVAEDVHQCMVDVLDSVIESIRFTQQSAREGRVAKPRWPIIILRTPKGWHSIKEIAGKRIEDNHYSHQVIAAEAANNPMELRLLEDWLRSYNFTDLFDGKVFDRDIELLVPPKDSRMGDSSHARGGDPVHKTLRRPDISTYSCPSVCDLEDPSCGEVSSMEQIGMYLRDVIRQNDKSRNFRLFSPDETYSNKLDAVFEATTRSFVWPHKEWDRDLSRDGRVIEMLSEHSLQGLMQGYVLTGRHGVFPSYEAFMPIVSSMTDQYAKFLAVAREVKWRGDIASLNYILTSSAWRQEHNGFSHQNPGFIDDILQRQGCFVNVYFPADANTALVVIDQMLVSKKEINVMVSEKRPLPCWRTLPEAREDLAEGMSIWNFASDDDPHLVFVGIGDYMTKEVLAAINLIHKEIPGMRLRLVNVTSLSAIGIGNTSCRILRHDINHYFTTDKLVVINFHGYPQTIKQVLFDYDLRSSRFSIHGYEEHGSTTTPFDMMVRNKTDRYHLVLQAFAEAEKQGLINKAELTRLIYKYDDKLKSHRAYVIEHGDDPKEITNWTWQPR